MKNLILIIFLVLISSSYSCFADITVISPLNGTEILNTLSTTLNVTISGGFQNITYSWTNGIRNYTLCNQCNGTNFTTINFPRQSYYNLSVFSINDSTGVVTSKMVSNLFVGNETTFYANTGDDMECGTTGTGCSDLTGLSVSTDGGDESYVYFNLSTANLYNNSKMSIKDDILAYFFVEGHYGNGPTKSTAYRINISWDETQSSAPSRKESYGNQVTVPLSGWYYYSLTLLYNNFFNGTYSDYGFQLNMDSGDTFDNRFIEDSEGSQGTTNYPFLNITYYSINTPPSITILSPQNDSKLNTTSNFNITFNISDDNDYLLNASLLINGTLNASISNPFPNTQYSFYFNATGGTYNVTVRAYDSDGVSNESSIILRINYPPTLKTDLTFTNSSAGHRFNATATFTDNDGIADILSRTIENSSGYCDYNSNTTSGNDITIKYNCSGTALTSTIIRINATDSGNQVISTSQLTNVFPNQAPTMTSVSLNKTANVLDTDDLNCSAVGKADADNDITVYHYEWYNDSIAKGIDNVKLSYTNLSGLGTWYCEAWVNDTYSISSKYTSSNVIIGSSEVSPSITTINATTNNLISNAINPTNNNSNINFSILFSDANTNLWTSYICTTPTAADCFNNVSGSILCKSESNLSANVLSCNYPTSGYSGTNPKTVYGFVLDNMTLYSSSSSTTFEINYPANAPILLNPSINTYINTNYMQINWSATDPDSDTINSSLYINSILIYNGTEKGFNYSSLTEYTTYTWQVFTIDQHSYGINNISLGNFTTDYTKPNMTVTSPSATTYNSINVSLTINASDFKINVCNYSIYYKDTNILKETATTSCIGTSYLSAPYYSGGYKLDVFAYDFAGNVNSTEINFTTQEASAPPPSGGGGGASETEKPITTCTNDTKWAITSLGDNKAIDLYFKVGAVTPKEFAIKLKNTGFENKTITLDCINTGGNICGNINFSSREIELQPNIFQSKELPIYLSLPSNYSYGQEYKFTIQAKDECIQTVSVLAKIPEQYSITGNYISIGQLEIPKFFFAIMASIASFFVIFFIFKLVGLTYLPWFMGFASMVGMFVIVIFV